MTFNRDPVQSSRILGYTGITMDKNSLLALHPRTQTAIVNGNPGHDAAYPIAVDYPALRGKTVTVIWSSWGDWWAARCDIIVNTKKTGSGKPRNAHPKQKAYVSMLKRNGWL